LKRRTNGILEILDDSKWLWISMATIYENLCGNCVVRIELTFLWQFIVAQFWKLSMQWYKKKYLNFLLRLSLQFILNRIVIFCKMLSLSLRTRQRETPDERPKPPLALLTCIMCSNEILGWVGVEKSKPFRTVQSLNFPPFETNDICLYLIGT
jgi:hypothetical protein